MEQHFIYITTNLVNGNYYIGKKSTSLKNLDPTYMGSGKNIQAAIKKYGREKLRREIICFTNSKKANAKMEAEIVTIETVKDPMCYNIALGGAGGDLGTEVNARISASAKGNTNHAGHKHSPETRAKMSEAHRNLSDETRAKMSATRKGKTHSPETRAKMSAAKKGKTHSPETRDKLSAISKAYWEAKRLTDKTDNKNK